MTVFCNIQYAITDTYSGEPNYSWVERGEIDAKPAGWNNEFFDELTRFPEGAHDDIVDSFSGAYAELFGKGPGIKKDKIPKGSSLIKSGGFT